ncbi:hypothetical protein DL96DRAFT_995865 [Flagelloscypha sp. PMI_526]|nr:hypothetical protein DL96DRAFT_995865 [Flagelloscypha sp. PMI_526]
MLTGDHPWGKLSQFQALFKIGSGIVKSNIPSDISNEAQDFLDKTFELDYTVRPSATELLAHSWLAKEPLPFFRKPGMVREVGEPIQMFALDRPLFFVVVAVVILLYYAFPMVVHD